MDQLESSLDHDSSHWIEMKEDTSVYSSNENIQTSRFRVAPVPVPGEGCSGSHSMDFDDAVSSPVGSLAQRTLGYSNSYDTRNVKSLRHYTRDALPRADHYRNILSLHGQLCRPTLDELHGGQNILKIERESAASSAADGLIRFGWIQGVLIRCLLNIWGVILFIRISWVVANAGIGLAFVIIILASAVTTITSLSMSAICTNGEVKGGGTYYMISRSLGPEFGGSIGVIFAIANAVAIAMYSVGFAETLKDIFIVNNIEITGTTLNDIRLISCMAVCLMLAIALVGTEWENKAQLVLLAILLAALIDYFIGCMIPPSDEQKAKGFVGWSAEILAENFKPDFRSGENFFSVFSVYFPAATGILAGANISGDLKDPQQSIPLGTLLAILITTATYLVVAFLAGGLVLRDANGLHLLQANASFASTVDLVRNCSFVPGDKCPYGLHNNNQIIEMIAPFGPLIFAGIFAASLSSALASLVSAPKVFQALCKDKLFPYIEYFGLGYGKNNEPRRGYFLAFAVATGCCIIGDLNLIAPIISNFFLAAYCLINFSCFHASFAKSLGFRPSFKYYNMWVSLMGAVLCIAVMFMTNWPAALITFLIVCGLYLWVMYRKPDVNWGSSTQAQTYRSAIQSVYKLSLLPEHVKNYRPQILLLSGCPSDRPPLVDFAYSITKGLGLLVCAQAVTSPLTQKTRENLTMHASHYLLSRKIKAFFCLGEDTSLSKVARSMFQSLGIGKLRPNAVLLGFKSDWLTCPLPELSDYFNVIHETFDRHLAIAILRVPGGLDYSKYGMVTDIAACYEDKSKKSLFSSSLVSIEALAESAASSNLELSSKETHSSPESSPSASPELSRRFRSQGALAVLDEKSSRCHVPKDILTSVNRFQRKQKRGTIDVWWLYDDGGLTILLPYILSTRSQWRNCKLRVFALANRKDQLNREQRNMAALLNKFRIDYSDVTVVPGVVKAPQQTTRQKFTDLISKFRTDDRPLDSDQQGDGLTGGRESRFCDRITESEIVGLKDKINRHLRLHELLQEHSRDASLVVMTLSMPRKGAVSAPMYLAWLEMLTQQMPPFLLIRGNQTNVLTFYS